MTQLAEIRGWSWAHFRPAMTTKGWRTPVSGPLGKGWPDLVLARPNDRILFVELKRNRAAKETPEQRFALDWLGSSKAIVYTWRPEDWETIEWVLR